MPSTSKKQHNFMEMVAHNPKMAKKVGVPQSVGKDFVAADKGKKFAAGGIPQDINKQKTHHTAGGVPNFSIKKYAGLKGGGMAESKKEIREEMKLDTAQDKKLIKKAFSMHDKQEHKGQKGTNLSKLKEGGVAKKVTKEMEYDYKTGKKSFSGSAAKRDAHAEKEGKIVAKHAAYDKSMGVKKGGSVKASAMGSVKTSSNRDGIAQRGHTKGRNV
jgi:hypothetical protein